MHKSSGDGIYAVVGVIVLKCDVPHEFKAYVYFSSVQMKVTPHYWLTINIGAMLQQPSINMQLLQSLASHP